MGLNRASRPRRYKVYRIVGIIMSVTAAIIWIATIATLFLRWALDGLIRYDSDDGEVAYISNVAAAHKWGFILGTVTTGIPYFLTVLFTKLYYDFQTKQRYRRILSFLSVVSAFISSLSLILISIEDSINHKRAHYTFVALFVVFSFLVAVLTVIYRDKKYQFNWVLAIRAMLIGLDIPLVIAFVVLGALGGQNVRSNLSSVAASLEWSIAILFILYLATFAFDLLLYS